MLKNTIFLAIISLGFGGTLDRAFSQSDTHDREKDKIHQRYELVYWSRSESLIDVAFEGCKIYFGDYENLAKLAEKDVRDWGKAKEAFDKANPPFNFQREPIYVGAIRFFHKDGFVGEHRFQLFIAAREKRPESTVGIKGIVRLRNEESGWYLDFKGPRNPQWILLAENETEGGWWEVIEEGDNVVRLRNVESKWFLDFKGPKNPQEILGDRYETGGGLWEVIEDGDAFRLRNAESGFYLDYKGRGNKDIAIGVERETGGGRWTASVK